MPHLSLELSQTHGNLLVNSESKMTICPLADGKPIWKGHGIVRAMHAGKTLLLFTAPVDNRKAAERQSTLAVLVAPAWGLAAEYSPLIQRLGAAISSDGEVFARQTGDTGVEVRNIANPGRIYATVPRGMCHNNLEVRLGDAWLRLRRPNAIHFFNWETGKLDYRLDTVFVRGAIDNSIGIPLATGNPDCLRYDPKRFRKYAVGSLIAVCDEFGQVALLDHGGELVCMFFAFRRELAVWMPDGTRLGSTRVGGPPTPDAATRIGRALLEASLRGERSNQ
jgi:hypothetical protein